MVRRSLIALCVLLVLLGGLGYLATRIISADDVKQQIGEQISAWTGREVSLQGDAVITVLPNLSVKLKDVRIAGPDGGNEPFVTMRFLKASIRILPLFIGEVQVENFSIVAPDIRLVREADGRRSWDFDSGAAALQLAFAGDVRLGSFSVQEGHILYIDEITEQREELSNVNLGLKWDSVRRPIEVSGRLDWRGAEVNLSASAQEPYRFIRGGETPLSADLQSTRFNGSFSGTMRNPRQPALLGRGAFNAEDLTGFLTWVGNPYAETTPVKALRIDSNVEISGRKASFSDASVAVNGVSGRGAFTLDLASKPSLSGTLAFPSLDMSPAIAHLVDWQDGENLLSGRINADWLDEFSADLRVSAEEMRLKSLRLSSVGASLLVNDGKATLTIAEAGLYGGRLSGFISLAQEENVPAMEASLRAGAVKGGDLLAALGLSSFAGLADISAELRSGGERLLDMVEGLQGRVSVAAANGRLPYIDLAAIRSRKAAETTPLLSANASTDFTSLAAEITFAEEIAHIANCKVENPGYTAELSGDVGLESRTLALSGTMTAKSAGAEPMPVRIVGTLASPEVALSPPPSN
ncbi:AsmA family protein [Afifella sp. IM 167]|uniref:AsmA family protein n=1 Tax=Afifella sp. IM 167 TaxID=2033586 RepID=UPI001CD00840|nr:AsmA family protein [Afifella sp. IM 167]MBZ8135077.1 hypothetical protein [Afifella sp. IM 167]